jgi:hypothetical protein
MMHGREKSGSAIGVVKPTNKAARSAAEPAEPRAGAKGNADQHGTRRAQNRAGVSQALERIRAKVREKVNDVSVAERGNVEGLPYRTCDSRVGPGFDPRD